MVHSDLGDLFLPLEGVQDVEAEISRLGRETREDAGRGISKAEQKLNNPSFTAKAPAHVLAEHQQRLAEWQSKRERIQAALDRLRASK